MKDRQTKAYLFALAAVLCWSTVATAFKLSLRYLSVAELLFYAAVISSIVLSLILIHQGKWPLVRQSDRSDWRRSLLQGALNPFLYYLLVLKAYQLLPAQQAQPINYTWAITLSLLSVPLLGHRLGRKELVATAISYGGVVVISTEGDVLSLSVSHPLGVALALGSTLIWAFYWILNARDRRDPIVGLLGNFLCSLPLIGLYLLITEGFRLPPLAGLAGALYVGCLEMGVAYVAWLMAMKYTRSTARVANLIFISPFLSLVFIHYLVGERILPSSFVGLVLIVIGLLLQSLGSRQEAKSQQRHRVPPAGD